jgi:DDE superfamily endonuclease
MPNLPADTVLLLSHCAPLRSRRTWRRVPLLVVGALLAPGRRMISAALRAAGLAHLPTVQTSHRLLHRDPWSSLNASRILLCVLIATCAADNGPLVLGVDETFERRRGKQSAAAGSYRAPVRFSHSSHGHFVNVNGLPWVCLRLLVPIPWPARMGAVPFLHGPRSLRSRRRWRGAGHG